MQPSTSREGDVGGQNSREIEERIHQQLMYKDNRIIDLNDVILDKERQILDLQERVREQGEVATMKNEAMKIVQKKFEEINRERRDMATETDNELLFRHPTSSRAIDRERRARSSSPGHVIANGRQRNIPNGTFSPPPIDPPTEETDLDSSYDIDGVRKKNRKRVTFDLPPSNSGSTEQLSSALTMASSENEILRKQIEEMNEHVEKMREQYEEEISRYMKEAKTAGVRAKVVATARIKELERSMEESSRKHASDVDRLQTEVETLRSSREWELQQNGQLREQVAHLKEKSYKLNEELDVSEKAKRSLDKEVEKNKRMIDTLFEDLEKAHSVIGFLEDQKDAIFVDIDNLKKAIDAQNKYIDVLEADIVIYEEHIGLLRESLGASKVDHRALIKSKAFETKLMALEREKEVSEKKSSEDRLRTKALNKKCQILQEENEKLMEKLCEMEMRHGEDHTSHVIADLRGKVDMLSSSLAIEKSKTEQLTEAKKDLEKKLDDLSAQTNLVDAEQREESEEVEFLKSEVERLGLLVDQTAENAEQLRAENFDLQMSTTKLREELSMRQLDHEQYVQKLKSDIEQAEKESNKVVEQLIKTDESNFTAQLDEKDQQIEDLQKEVDRLRKQVEMGRLEMENVRLSVQESAEVKREVDQLKIELEQERDAAKLQWEEACRRMEEMSDTSSRKNSIEIQQQEYISAFEEKIDALQKELQTCYRTITADKAEKSKLKKALKQIRDNERMKKEAQQASEDGTSPQAIQNSDDIANVVERAWDGAQKTAAPEAEQVAERKFAYTEEVSELMPSQKMELYTKMRDLELEARLSEELNVELGHAMFELEKKLDSVTAQRDTIQADHHAINMELRLHEMIVQEMSNELQEAQKTIEQLNEAQRPLTQDLAQHVVENLRKENQDLRNEINRVLSQVAEYDIARQDETNELQKNHEAVVRSLNDELLIANELSFELAEKVRKNGKDEQLPEQTVVEATTPVVTEVPSSDPVSVPIEANNNDGENGEVNREAIIEENLLLRQCLNQSVEVKTELSGDLTRLMQLKEELETAVDSLKAEIWSLNGQLKAALLDRENLEDRVISLDEQLSAEKKRALGLDVELQEQVDLTNKAMSRAAEAENESNRRLAECLDMESQREELEKAYASLTEYYNQLQEAYNVVYAKVHSVSGPQNEEELQKTENPEGADVSGLDKDVEQLVKILSIPTSPNASLTEKLSLVVDKIRVMRQDLEESRKALEEHKTIRAALEERLDSAEQRVGAPVDVHNTSERVEQLEGEIEWKEEECESLKRRIEELEKALDSIAQKANETEAARLTTRQADVDSLFRTNAELAHTNVRLQNELDEREEEAAKEKEESRKELDLMRAQVVSLEEQVADLQVKLKEESSKTGSVVKEETVKEQTEEEEEEWGWGEEKPTTSAPTSALPLQAEDNQQLHDEIDRLQAAENELKVKITALEKEVATLESKLEMVEEELFEAQSKDNDEKLIDDLKKEHTKTVAEKDDLIKKLEEEVEHQQSISAALEAEKLKNIEEIARLQSELQQKVDEPLATEEEGWGWGDDAVAPAEDTDEGLRARLVEVEEERNSQAELLARREQQLDELEKKLQEAEANISEEKSSQTQLLEKKDKEIASLQSRFDQTMQYLRSAEEGSAAIAQELDEAREELERLQAQKSAADRPETKQVVEPLKQHSTDWDDGDGWDEDGWGVDQKAQQQSAVEAQSEKIEELTRKIAELEESNRQYHSRSIDLTARQTAIENSMKEQLDARNEIIEQLKLKLREEETSRQNLESAESSEVELLKTEVAELKAEIADLQEKLKELDRLEKTLRETEAKLHHVQLVAGEEKTELESKLTQAVENTTQERFAQAELLAAKDDEIALLKTKFEETMKYLRTAEEGSASIAQELDETRDELERVQEELQKTKQASEIVVQKEEDVVQQSGWDDDNAWNDDSNGWGDCQKKENQDEKVAELTQKIELLEKQNEQYNSKCSELTSKLSKVESSLKEQIKERNQIIEKLELELMEIQDEEAARRDLESTSSGKVEELRKEVAELTLTVGRLQKELKASKDQNEVLKDSEGRLFDQANSYAETVEKYKQQSTNLKKKVAELEAAIAEQKKANEEEVKAVKLAAAKAVRHQKAVIAATRSPAVSRPSSRMSTASSTRPGFLREEADDDDTASVRSIPISNPLQSAFDPVIPQTFAIQVAEYLERQEGREQLAEDLLDEMTKKNRKNSKNVGRGPSVSPPLDDVGLSTVTEATEPSEGDVASPVQNDDEKVRELSKKNEEYEKKIEKLQLDLADVTRNIESVQLRYDEVLEKMQDAEELNSRTVTSQQERIDSLNSELAIARENEVRWKSEVELLRNEQDKMEDTVQRKMLEVVHLEAENKEASRQYASLVTSMNEVKTGEEVVKHLQSDNVRLEREVFRTHEELTSLKEHLADLKKGLDAKDVLLLEASNESTRLRNALEMEKFEKQQALMAADGRDATARVLELERQISEMKTSNAEKVEELIEEMRTCEERMKLAEEKESSAIAELKTMETTMESWRTRFENAAAENESMQRQVGEVRSLELVLQKTKAENESLADELDDFKKQTAVLTNEKQELIEKLTSVSELLAVRSDRLAKAGETRMEQTMKIMELEIKLGDANQKKRIRANSLGGGTSDPSSPIPSKKKLESWRSHLEQDSDAHSGDVIDLETGRNVSEQEEFLPSTPGLAQASQPWNQPLSTIQRRLSRRLLRLRHKSPFAIFPYFRYALMAYFLFIHFLLLHCWYF